MRHERYDDPKVARAIREGVNADGKLETRECGE